MLETVFEYSPAGFAFVNRDLEFVRVNRRISEITGRLLEEIVGRRVSAVLGQEVWQTRIPYFEGALAGEPTFDVRLSPVRKERAEVQHLRNSYIPVRASGEVVGVVVIVNEITEQVETQEKLRRQSLGFEILYEALIITDLEGLVQQCNGAFTRRTGYTEEEVIGKPISMLHRPDERETIFKSVAEGVLSDGHWSGELRFVCKDGSEGICEASVAPLLGEDGEVIGLVGANHDITDRKRMEEEILSLLGESRVVAAQRWEFVKDVLASVTAGRLTLCSGASELPPCVKPISRSIHLNEKSGLNRLRRETANALTACGFTTERRYDMVTAVNEAAMNAVVHAGAGTARVNLGGEDCIQVVVHDSGPGIAIEHLPKATLRRGYSTKQTFGHGFKLMLETADRVYLLTSPSGTSVVLEQHLSPLSTLF